MNEDNLKMGYVPIFRSITKHWLWQEKPFTKGQAWIDLLIESNHSDQKVRIGNELILCKRGESLKSLETWAERWGWDKSKVCRFLKMLESDTMVERIPTQKTTHLKIVNYETYNEPRNDSETKMKRKRNDSETILTPNNHVNHVNNENHEKPEGSFYLDKKDINNGEYKSASKQFREAYDLYQGTKRSLTTEFFEFKNIQDWAKCLPLLKPAIEKMNQARKVKESSGEFVPALKRFQNWLRDRGWETNDPEAEKALQEAQSKVDAEQKRIERRRLEYLETYGDYIRTAPADELFKLLKIGQCPKDIARELRPELFDKESA